MLTYLPQISWLLALSGLVAVLHLHLLPTLLAGLLMFVLVHQIAPYLQRHVTGARARVAVVALLASVLVGVVLALGLGLVGFFKGDADHLAALLSKLAQVLAEIRTTLPWLADLLPASLDSLQQQLVDWLKTHASTLREATQGASLAVMHVLMGLIIGALVSVEEARHPETLGPLAQALLARLRSFAAIFRGIVFAQVQISGINALLTALYLLVALPLFGIDLPFAKTMVAVTFLAGLLPAIGNIISNCVIVLVSLAHSPQVAGSSLLYLVVIHKLEYFLNARIIGGQLQMRAWELLVAILVMERLFGLAGIVAAPLVYAWLKRELVEAKLV